jgi:hypothetical protein
MRKFMVALSLAAMGLPAMPAAADPPPWAPAHGKRAKHDRDWRDYRHYDWNRRDPRYGGYYADRYYRDGRYYQPRRLTYADRIYRGRDGRYYCRRSDGTTGLIIGGAVGALLGREIDRGDSRALGTIVGAGAGALVGRSIDRGELRCR